MATTAPTAAGCSPSACFRVTPSLDVSFLLPLAPGHHFTAPTVAVNGRHLDLDPGRRFFHHPAEHRG
uniref:Uncharacterized protein n=1 Tax=Oryza meridionalis TaxID=40149 RepID=A0A0E0CXA9_9ORYZ